MFRLKMLPFSKTTSSSLKTDMLRPHFTFPALLLLTSAAFAASVLTPGKVTASEASGHLRLSNTAVAADWAESSHSLRFTDKLHAQTIGITSPFSILLNDGRILNVADLQFVAAHRKELTAAPAASRYSDRVPGVEFDIPWKTADGALSGTWSLVLRDGGNYVRELLTLTAGSSDVAIASVKLLDEPLPSSHVVGSVKGSPIVTGDIFLGLEHPLSESHVTAGRATAYINRVLPLKAGQTITYSAVIGVARTGQMRRDFLAYVERERAHPYRTFLHYNSWYDLGYFTPYTEQGAVDRINAFGTELHTKRGVTLDSFLFDDGWDDHSTLWHFHPKDFPNGFTNVRAAAEKYGADPGIWMSPWGGYSKPKLDRLDYGRKQGYEIVGNGFALSGPKYYERFHEVALDMVSRYGINQFKIDGTGNANSVFKGSAFDSDFAAALSLIGDLRQQKPDIYINLTTGTYPSPFWLMTADSIWRGGEDDDFAGVGSYRQRWITYRDADTYDRIVKAGPLFPLNSLMLHGMIYAQFHKHLNTDPGNDLRNEIRSYFGTGTQLQEIYMTPSLLTAQNWDDLAEAAKWSRNNAETLRDSHWVGGDPAWGEPYGWASWSPAKAILTLRNPSDKPKTITLDAQQIFELPAAAPSSFTAHSPWKDDASKPAITLTAGKPHTFQLEPFEVLTLEAKPQGK
jgi:hypothetical protein